jgi:DNA invertase Pin-like site-specific DNA recombinase
MELLPVGGYLRISDADLTEIRRAVKLGLMTLEEAEERERKGVLKQREDILGLAERHGIVPERVVFYEDNNLSAFQRTVKRKDFERMVGDLKAKRLGGILGYDIDRIFRQPRDLERVIDVYETTKIPLVFDTLSGQNFDLTTADGRFSARLFVNIANKSSEDTSRRIKRENKRKAEHGEFHGGTPAYGWDPDDRKKVDPKAAKVLNDGADAFIAGDKMGTIQIRWQEAGVVSPNNGKPFSQQNVRKLLMRARNAGIRVYQGEPLKDDDGNYVMGDWPAIMTVEKWEAVMATIAKRQRKESRDTTTKYLLSGIARCGRCGYKLRGIPVWDKKRGKQRSYAYVCEKRFADQCGALSISGGPTDELVRKLVWGSLQRSLAARDVKKTVSWGRDNELTLVEKDIAELKAKWSKREIRAAIYATTLESLEQERDALRADKALFITSAEQPIEKAVLESGWTGLSLERQRDVVRTVLVTALMHPAKSRGARFDPSRIEPVFTAA